MSRPGPLPRLLWFGVRLLIRLPDRAIAGLLRLAIGLRRIAGRKDHSDIVLHDLVRIFDNPAAAAVARRLVLEARPEQAWWVIRGALRP